MDKRKGIHGASTMKNKKKYEGKKFDDGFDRSNKDTIASHVDRWLVKQEIKNHSERTVDTYKKALHQFIRWCEERDLKDPTVITKVHLESFQRYLWRYKKTNGKPLAVNSQRQRLSVIQRFFSYLVKSNFLMANPASDLELPKKPHRLLPRGLSMDEVNELLNYPDITDPLGIRDRAILETFYASGIRRSELVKLDVKDIDLQARTLYVNKGKGGKSRLLPIGKQCVYWVERYLDVTRIRLLVDHNEQGLFLTGYGTKFTSDSLGVWFRRIKKKLGIEKDGLLHLFRHSCATHMLESGADIRFIQQMLGHASLETTSVYTQVAINQLQGVYDQTHPRA